LISLLRKYVSAKGKKLFTGKNSDVNAIIEYRAKDKSGNWHYLESTANIMENELLLVSKDITERKKAEEEIKETNNIINASSAVVFLWKNEEDWPVELVSDNVKELIGYTVEEFTSGEIPYVKIIHPDDLDRVIDEVAGFSRGKKRKKIFHEPYRIIAKDGKVKWIDDRTLIRRDEKGRITHYQGIILDITERRQAGEALRDSRYMLQTVLDSIPAAVFWKDIDSIYLGGNRTWLETAGLKSLEEVVGMNDYDLPWGKEQADSFRDDDRKVMESGIPEYDIIEPYLRFDGIHAWARTNKVPLRDEEGNITGILGTYEDITERKKAEEELNKTTQTLNSVLSHTHMMAVYLDPKFNFIWVNQAYADTCKHPPSFFPGKNHFDLYPGEEVEGIFQHVVNTGKPFYIEAKPFEFPDQPERGTTYWDWSLIPVKDFKEKITGLVFTLVEVTDRVKSKEKITHSAKVLSEVTDAVFSIKNDKEFTITSWNKGAEKVYGWKEEEILGKSSAIFKEEFSGKDKKEVMKDILKNGCYTGDAIHTRKEGTKIDIDVNLISLKDKDGKITEWISVNRDITEEKKAKKTLQESEEKYSSVVENSMDGIIVLQKGIIKFFNQAILDLSGYNLEELMDKEFEILLSPEYRKFVMSRYQARPAGKDIPAMYEMEITRKDGILVPIEISNTTITYGGKKAILSFIRNITERKQAKQSLQEAEVELTHTIEVVPGIIAKANIHTGYFTHCNPALSNILGFSSEDFLARPFIEFVHPDDRQSTTNEIEKQLKGSPVARFENRYICKDGSYKWLEWRATTSDEKGVVYAAATDITERKQAELEIQMERNKLTAIFEAMEDGIYIVNKNYDIQYLNPALKKEFGSHEGEKCYKYFHDLDEPCTFCKNKDVFAGKTVHWEWTSPKNGKTYDLIDTPMKNADDSIVKLEIFRDITEHKKVEQILKKSKEIAESYLNVAAEMIITLDTKGNISLLNESGHRLLGYKTGELIGRSWFDICLPEREREDVREIFKKLMLEDVENVENYENRVLTKNGDEKIILWHNNLLRDDEGMITGILSSGEDITERKNAEEKTERQNEINALRAEIWELSAQPLSEDELIQQLVDKIGPFFNLEHASFLRIYPKKKKVIVDIQWRAKDRESGIGEEFPLWLFKRYLCKPYKIISLRNIPSVAKPIIAPIFKKFDVKSTLLVPYGDIGNPQGYIATAGHKADKEWSKDEIDVFSEAVGIIFLKTEEIKAEEKAKKHQRKIERQNIKLKRLDRIKTDFLNSTSHELRTPMAAIKGYIQMLLRQTMGDITPDQKDALNVVLRNTNRLDHLIQDILDISRLESGTMKFIPEKNRH